MCHGRDGWPTSCGGGGADDGGIVLTVCHRLPHVQRTWATRPCDGDDFGSDGLGDTCDSDIDADGVQNTLDACDFTPLGIPVNADGRPLLDANLDCVVDLRDYAEFQRSMFGPVP